MVDVAIPLLPRSDPPLAAAPGNPSRDQLHCQASRHLSTPGRATSPADLVGLASEVLSVFSPALHGGLGAAWQDGSPALLPSPAAQSPPSRISPSCTCWQQGRGPQRAAPIPSASGAVCSELLRWPPLLPRGQALAPAPGAGQGRGQAWAKRQIYPP